LCPGALALAGALWPRAARLARRPRAARRPARGRASALARAARAPAVRRAYRDDPGIFRTLRMRRVARVTMDCRPMAGVVALVLLAGPVPTTAQPSTFD